MHRQYFTLAILAGTLVLSSVAFAGEGKGEAESVAAKELKNQTHCPVMGGKIDSAVFTDIQGQRVYHCCPMCSDKLKADPDKYFKKAAEEGVLFENIQTVCPVSGKELKDRSVFSDHEGRRVYFCCEGCIAAFDKDPSTHLSKLDSLAVKQPDAEQSEGGHHSGHNH
jgi:YHS domain-containing protein